MDDVGEVVELEVGDVVGDGGDTDVGVELEEDPVYSFNTLLNSVDVGVLVDDVEEGVELCELALWLLGVDVEELVDGEDVGVELVGVDVGDDGVEDEGVLVGGEEDGVGTGDEVGDVVELFCGLGCELADEDGAELDGVDVGVLVGVDVEEGVELCELADVDEGVELLLCELTLSMVFIASLRNCV